VLDQLLSDRVFNTLLLMQNRYGTSNTYSIVEYMSDVKAGVWTELVTKKPVNIYRRSLQKNYVSNVLASVREAEEGTHYMGLLFGGPMSAETQPVTVGSDVGSYLSFHLQQLRTEILAAIPLITDKDTKDHYNYIAQQIKTGLANQFVK